MVVLAPEREQVAEEMRELRASALGTSDGYCHVMAGDAPFTETECGMTLERPLWLVSTHRGLPCPNGNPTCPYCTFEG